MPIEYEQSLFTKWPIDFLNGNILERLKVSSIKQSFYEWIYESNARNDDFNILRFYGDKRLITR